jgi:hypothetical protein
MTALPPKPMRNFYPLRFSPPMIATDVERRSMIEVAAYLRAERRNFEPGHDVEDWLAAEAEVNERLAYLQRLTGLQMVA